MHYPLFVIWLDQYIVLQVFIGSKNIANMIYYIYPMVIATPE